MTVDFNDYFWVSWIEPCVQCIRDGLNVHNWQNSCCSMETMMTTACLRETEVKVTPTRPSHGTVVYSFLSIFPSFSLLSALRGPHRNADTQTNSRMITVNSVLTVAGNGREQWTYFVTVCLCVRVCVYVGLCERKQCSILIRLTSQSIS